MGGSATGVWLSREFRGRQFSVRLYETDRARAEELADKLDHVTVVQADPTNPLTFFEEHIRRCDVFIALSNNDEHNILGGVQAQSMGVQRCIVVIQQPTYLNVLERVGIDRAFSPRVIASREIQRVANKSPLQLMATLAEGVADIYQVQARENSLAVGQSLSNLELPAGCRVAAIQRGDQVHVPAAADRIEPGDGVVVIAKRGSQKQLRRFFLGG
jgi:trk system potassium uptake protein TrkA